MKMQIHLDDKEFIANLEKAMSRMPGRSEELMEDACKIVEAKAKDNCPVDSGVLAGSISHLVDNNGDTTDGYIYTEVEYAPYVHDGTSKMASRPFLSRATITERPKVVKVFKEFFEDLI